MEIARVGSGGRRGPQGGWIRVGVVRGMWLGVLYALVISASAQVRWGATAVLGGALLGLLVAPVALMFGMVAGAIVAAAAEGIDRLPGERPPWRTAVCSILVVVALVTTAVIVGRAVASSDDGLASDLISTVPALAFWLYGPAGLGLLSLVVRPLRAVPVPRRGDELVVTC